MSSHRLYCLCSGPNILDYPRGMLCQRRSNGQTLVRTEYLLSRAIETPCPSAVTKRNQRLPPANAVLEPAYHARCRFQVWPRDPPPGDLPSDPPPRQHPREKIAERCSTERPVVRSPTERALPRYRPRDPPLKQDPPLNDPPPRSTAERYTAERSARAAARFTAGKGVLLLHICLCEIFHLNPTSPAPP